jgi:cation:H+ antiporter
MWVSSLLIVAGMALLALSGHKLVDFAVALAARARLTPAIIGLTVVAAGTSMPELLVSTTAALRGSPEIALANVVGSNIANIGLILGFCALLTAIPVRGALLKFEYPFLLLASWVAFLLCRDGRIDRVESAFFVTSAIVFNAYSIWAARQTLVPREPTGLPAPSAGAVRWPAWGLVLGLAATFVGLSLGAHLLVTGAVGIALGLGVSERVVGLTVVAVGTSLPELVASVAAAVKRQVEMAVTNVVGSNIFNLLLILGLTGLVRPMAVADKLVHIDMPIMLGISVLLMLLVARDKSLSRRGGAILLAAYATYLVVVGVGL